jgi:hypothetical protein
MDNNKIDNDFYEERERTTKSDNFSPQCEAYAITQNERNVIAITL